MKTFFKALGNVFKKPVTTKYPFEKTFIPDDYRGLIGFDENLCIWCRRCEMVCPPGAIVFSQDMEGKQTYHFNRAVCIYCGECVRACPKEGAIFQTPQKGHHKGGCYLRDDGITVSTQFDHSIGNPMSQRECSGFNTPFFSVGKFGDCVIRPETVGISNPWVRPVALR